MIENIKTKIVATLLLTIMMISNIIQLFPLLESNATSIGDSIYIESIGKVEYHLKSHETSSGGFVITELAGYKDNGKFYPAYCLDHDLHGADGDSGYNVTLTELIKDTDTYNKVWRTTVAGYPYHTAEELGVSDWTYAYQATKMAIYCVTGQANVNSFYASDSIGQQIVDLIKRLVDEGENGSSTYKTPVAEITKEGEVSLEGDYYTQKYNLTTNLDISDFSLTISGFPNGTILTDLNGNVKDTFTAGEQFQVKMPKEVFEVQNINGRIRATVKTKEYAIFYGKTYDEQRQNYALTADPISLTNCSTDISIKNNNSSIKIYKYNEDKSSAIQGVTFELLKEDGTVVKTVQTDENGIATFDNLFQGKYYAREKGTVKGYLLNDERIEISVGYNSTTEATLTNEEPTGEIKLIKTDSETGNQDRADKKSHHGDATLDGTVYTIYAGADIYNVAKTVKYFSKDDVIGTYTFDSYGMAVVKITNNSTPAKLESNGNILKGLPMGSYYVKETAVPQGYLQDNQTHNFELTYKDENTKVIKIENTLTNDVEKGRFEVIKMSSITNTTAPVVEGAEFTAILTKYVDYYGSFDEALKHLDEFAKDEYSIFKTESNGHSISGLLAYGQYTVNETYCPSDRINPVKEFYVNIDKNSNSPIKELIENDTPFTSYIKMIKLDKKTGKKVTFSNATFSLYKLNETNNQWEKVFCKLGRESFDTWTTDKNGIAYTETKLEAGKYKIDEVKVPTGFLQLDEECIFEVSRSNKTVEYDKDMDAYITVEIKNEQPIGTLIVDKSVAIREDVDKSFVDVSDLSKIEFKLTAKNDILDMADGSVIYKAGQEVKTFNLDKNGNYTLEDLPMGEYQLQETKTLDGLVLDETVYDVIFTQKDLTTKIYEEKKNIENKPTEVEFSKTDITGEKELVGAKLTVTDENDEIIDSWVSNEKTHKIEGLKVGKEYTLTEEIAPDGFVKATSIKFTVENTAEIQKVTMIDKQVTMSKEDVGGNEVEGAKLKVVDKEGNIVDSWTSTKEVHKINGLVEGETYTLYEDYAPDGFVISSSVEFTVTEDKETQEIKMIDKQVTMSKEDVGGNEVEGAELKVVDKDGNIVDSWTSTKEVHKIKGLVEGETYTLYEDYAPDGFVISNSVEFTVTEDKETQEIKMIDKQVEISKVDIAGDELEGATLVVTSTKTKNIVDKWVSEKEPHKVSGLIEGETYVLTEEIAIDGYVKATSIEFTVTNEKDTQKIEMVDKRVSVKKTDFVTGDEIEGAELEITDKDGNVVDSWTSGNEEHYVTGLTEGETYTLTEKTCPYGYEQAENIEFTVSEDKETQKIEMKDMPILKDIKVVKIDSKTKEVIKDEFTFGIYEDQQCTKLIKEIQANKEDGFVIFEDLRYGEYYIKELQAPTNYNLSTEIAKVEINDKGVFVNGNLIEESDNVYSYEFENIPIETPKTSDNRNQTLLKIIAVISSVLLTIMGLYGFIKRRKNK